MSEEGRLADNRQPGQPTNCLGSWWYEHHNGKKHAHIPSLVYDTIDSYFTINSY